MKKRLDIIYAKDDDPSVRYTCENVEVGNVLLQSVAYWRSNGFHLVEPEDLRSLNDTIDSKMRKSKEQPMFVGGKPRERDKIFEEAFIKNLDKGEEEARKIAEREVWKAKKKRVTLDELKSVFGAKDEVSVSEAIEELIHVEKREKREPLRKPSWWKYRKKMLRTTDIYAVDNPVTHIVSIMGSRGKRRYTIVRVEVYVDIEVSQFKPAQWLVFDDTGEMTVTSPAKAKRMDKKKGTEIVNPYQLAQAEAKKKAMDWFDRKYLKMVRMGYSELDYLEITTEPRNLVYHDEDSQGEMWV